jgi:phosphate transport system substrate-binding protein
MNDEFLHALRREPPPRFASELKRRLDRQSAQRKRATRVRAIVGVLLVGGLAMAAALLLRGREEPMTVAAPRASVATSSSAPASNSGAARRAGPLRLAPAAASEDPQPQEGKAAAATRKRSILVASSLTLPIAQALMERSGSADSGPPPIMVMEPEEVFSALCAGVGMVIASRRITSAELRFCNSKDVDVVEWKIGYQAVAITAGPTAERAALSPREVFLALARRIPDPVEPTRLIDNPNMTWHDVDGRFDSRSIDFIAPADAALRRALGSLVMEPGCDTYPWIRELKKTSRKRYDEICHGLRSDGRYREVEMSNTLITQQLWAEPNWLLVLGYSLYAEHRGELLPTMLDGPEPTLASLEDGTYPAARPVYVYANEIVLYTRPLRMLTNELTDEWAVGPQGYLRRVGLVPLTETQRRAQHERPFFPPPALKSLQP